MRGGSAARRSAPLALRRACTHCQSNSPSSLTILTAMPFTSPTTFGLQWSLNFEKPSARLTNVQLDESVVGALAARSDTHLAAAPAYTRRPAGCSRVSGSRW